MKRLAVTCWRGAETVFPRREETNDGQWYNFHFYFLMKCQSDICFEALIVEDRLRHSGVA